MSAERLPERSGRRKLDLESPAEQAKRVLLTAVLAGAVAALFLMVWQIADIVLLVFASLLLAVFLRGLAEFLCRHTPLSTGWALAVVVFGLLGLAALIGGLYGPALADTFDGLLQTLPHSMQGLRNSLGPFPGSSALFDALRQAGNTLRKPENLARIAGVFSSALGALGSILVVAVMGLYFSAEPGIYRRGLLKLVPPRQRGRAGEVLHHLRQAEQSWLLGRIASMTVVGVLSWLGLLIIGMPFAFILGLLAGTLSFIPNLGPILATIPAAMVGFTVSPAMALYAVIVYTVVQTAESYLITPYIQQHMISLPPAMLLTVQLAMGAGFGILGVLLATPLAVMAMVLIQDLYLGETAGDEGRDSG